MRLIRNNTALALGAFALMAIALSPASSLAADAHDHGAESHEPMIEHLIEDAEAYDHAVTEDHHADEAHGDGHGEVQGLPQLDFSTYPSQIFWLFIAFIILYFIYSKKTLPEISSTIENRHNQVDGDLETAEKLKEEADGVQAAYEEILSKARGGASDVFKKTEEKIKAKTEKKLGEFRERSATLTQETEKEVAKAKDDAMTDMQSVAAEVASIAAEKIVGISPDIDQAKTLVKNMNKKAA
jgi:F-type H+-transporting ATPase subunit b